jgi:hypothetical protein
MIKPKLIIASALLVLLSLKVGAQQLRADTTTNKQSTKSLFINAGLQYLSDLTYAGRRDASSVPVLLPTFTLISTKGFFLSGIGYFDLNGVKSAAEGLSITPGYVFSFDKNKYYGGAISATKYFITDNSPIILSSFNATVDGQLHFNPDNIIKLTVDASYRFSKQGSPNDVINDAELSKEIQLTKAGKDNKGGLKITPTVTLYSGTQSFYQASTSQTSSTTPLGLLSPPQTVTTGNQVRQYTILALSGSMLVAYVIKTWQISFTPYLIQPYHQVNYTTSSPQNGSYFLFTTGVSVTF